MSAAVLDDPLSSLAPLLRVRPVLDDLCRFGGVWDSPHDAEGPGWAHFHIVTRGECLLERVGQGPLPLKAGDVLLLPHGDPHVVRARRGSFGSHAGVTTEYRNAIRSRTSIGIPPDTELICGRLHFDTAPESLLIAALPDIIVLRPTDWPDAERMRFMLESVRDELDSDRAGAAAIATDLASALFMMMLRAHLETSGTSEGLLRLLRHRPTARAVLAMLREPARDWTLDELAACAAASRATLVRAFRAAIGCPPLAFLTDLRLGLARQQLLRGTASIAQIAEEIGYRSEAALSRAMHRRYKVRPGELRRHATVRRGALA
jgi:AraC family transcriptional regulator, activator of mtrCDE